jgi:hypothetical protein
LSDKTQQQWFFNNFHMIMAIEDATKKLKFSSGFFLQ